jgi:cyclopropane fatty-acyl-phospholipid synthase-like methyltransferase
MTEQPQPANANKALWEKGDFTRIAATMRASGEALVGTLGITERLDVLDLGCGDGTTAIPEAMLGANVLGVDIAENLVAAGNARARDLGLSNVRSAMHPRSASWPMTASTSWSASSVRCSLPDRSTWPKRSFGSRGRGAGS